MFKDCWPGHLQCKLPQLTNISVACQEKLKPKLTPSGSNSSTLISVYVCVCAWKKVNFINFEIAFTPFPKSRDV